MNYCTFVCNRDNNNMMFYVLGEVTTKLLLPHLFTNSSDNKHQHGHLGYDPAVMTSREHFLPHGSQIHIPSLPPPPTNLNRHVPK